MACCLMTVATRIIYVEHRRVVMNTDECQGLKVQGQGLVIRGQGQGLVNWSSSTGTFLQGNTGLLTVYSISVSNI